MDRVRIAFGLLVVVIGTVWLLGGGTALRSGGRRLLVVLPYALIAFGLLLVLRAALPRGLLTAPLALIAGGGLWAAYDLGYLGGTAGSRILPALVIAAGAVVALAGGEGRGHPGRGGDDDPLRRYRSVLWPVRVTVAGAPELVKVGVGSYFGDARIDLAGAAFAGEALQVDVTVLFGRVELVLDSRCIVVKGNVESSPAVHFAEQVPVHVTPPTDTARHIVLNVLGVGGSVAVRRG
ncbi:hypothetical protein OG317_20535 [Streptomyces sp. NBC_01167]|uniref:hypothetical protein n=1 Tax=Streptomyces sp. NBC_01167 TaxID=2903756 RepID=UPI0038656216|nr:hypothetical protein OG317_20535 [Streptomyces sp. NBC_01167]